MEYLDQPALDVVVEKELGESVEFLPQEQEDQVDLRACVT